MAKFLKISCIVFLTVSFACEAIALSFALCAGAGLNRGPIDTLIAQKYNLPYAKGSFKFKGTPMHMRCEENLCDMVFFHDTAKLFFSLAFFSLFALIACRLKSNKELGNIIDSHAISQPSFVLSDQENKPGNPFNLQTLERDDKKNPLPALFGKVLLIILGILFIWFIAANINSATM